MKTRINKFMSLLLAMVMLISMITVVNVSAAIDGIFSTCSGTGTVVELSTEKGYDGVNSIYFDNTHGGKVWIGDSKADFGIESGKAYNMEFYMYPVQWSGAMWFKIANRESADTLVGEETITAAQTKVNQAYIMSNGNGGYKDTSQGWTIEAVTEGEKAGWFKVYNRTPLRPINFSERMFIVDGAIEAYIDNICLYEDGKTEPLVVKSFEPKIQYDARVDYMPKNFMAVQSGTTQMNISWRNPAAPAISSVKLYDITNPKAATEIVPETAFSADADGINSHYIDGVTSGATYVYRLDFTFADGTVKSYTTGCTAGSSKYSYKSGSYTLNGSHASTGNPGARMTLDDNIYATSAPSIHVVSNDTTFDSGTYMLLQLQPVTAIVPGNSYQVNLKIKHNNSQYIFTRGLGYKYEKTYYFASGSFTYNNGTITNLAEWTPYSTVAVAGSSETSAIQFTIAGSSEDFWIDDVEIYEYDTETETKVGDNILVKNVSVNTGAADDAQARPADLATVTATPEAFGTKLSWTAGEGQEYVAVYDKAMSEYTPVAYVPASLGEVTIANLEDGETYDYIVKTVNAEGRESENGTEVQALAGGEELAVTYYVPAKNLIVTQVSGTQISVSWRNPKATDGAISAITKAEIYDADTNALLYTSANTTANAIVEYLDTDFTVGTAKNYRLDLTYSDGAVKSQVAGYVPASTGYTYTAGSWQVISSYSVKPGAKLSVDDEVYRTSAPSIHVASNTTAGLDVADLRLKLIPSITLDTNKTYRIEGYAKMNNAGYIFEFMLGNTNRSFMIHDKWTQFLTHENWVKFTKDIVPDNAASPIINFNLADSTEDFWIDDVTLYELTGGEGTETTGDNLLAGIGTCDDVSAAPAELTGVSAKNRTNEAMIKWGDTDAAYVAVYDNNVSEDIPVAYVPASMGYVDLKNLDAGKTYNYTVKAVNAEGRESAAGVAVSATPLAEALVISDYKTSASGNEVTVSVDLKNNSYGNDLTAQLFLAVYDGKVLESIAQSDMTGVPQTELGADPVTVSTKINVPQGKTMVMYLWNSLDGMKPLKACEAYVAE